ncbi:uncharacterized protein A4U43_C03F13970 [Asparagus officinalis]|uniref:Uncharacterized protein n=1 Tax=Asparagus officinalis TaxID=4686 RepID=A0A5P1FE50_ASPOF|nr:uncharacterized protein A4U43_C03F13970 [Asparagus officinalis]
MRKLKYEARHANENEKWHRLRECLAMYDMAMGELEQAAEAMVVNSWELYELVGIRGFRQRNDLKYQTQGMDHSHEVLTKAS